MQKNSEVEKKGIFSRTFIKVKNKAKKDSDPGERGPLEKVMDRETAMVIFRAFGMPKPMTQEDWNEYYREIQKLLSSITEEQKEAIITSARGVADYRKRILEAYRSSISEEELETSMERIPLTYKKLNEKSIIGNFNEFNKEQQELLLELLQKGITIQKVAIQNLENKMSAEVTCRKIETVKKPKSEKDLEIDF